MWPGPFVVFDFRAPAGAATVPPMDTPDPNRIQPSGICRHGQHEWRHDPPGGKRLLCARCKSMSINNYGAACREDCADCHPPTPGSSSS